MQTNIGQTTRYLVRKFLPKIITFLQYKYRLPEYINQLLPTRIYSIIPEKKNHLIEAITKERTRLFLSLIRNGHIGYYNIIYSHIRTCINMENKKINYGTRKNYWLKNNMLASANCTHVFRFFSLDFYFFSSDTTCSY